MSDNQVDQTNLNNGNPVYIAVQDQSMQGDMVEIDLVAGTATLIGDAGRLDGKDADTGWTGLSFDAAGDLFAVSRISGEPDTGLPVIV